MCCCGGWCCDCEGEGLRGGGGGGGGDNFTPFVSICSEVMAVGHRESDSIEGSSYSGRSQCLSRPFKTIDRESRSVAQRMVSEGNSSTEDFIINLK